MAILSESFSAEMERCEEMTDLYLRYMKKMEEWEQEAAKGVVESDPDCSALIGQFKLDLKKIQG